MARVARKITASTIANLLSPWYEKYCRLFPWRERPDGYRIFLAEVLLQKTPASNVAQHYDKILNEFPSYGTLSEANISRLSALLKPLGLHLKRARTLKEASRKLLRIDDSGLLVEKSDLLSLRGVGPYTTAAILCFAQNRWEVPVDTNIRRVMSRLRGELETEDKEIVATLREPPSDMMPRDFFWAMIDLGAIVCRKTTPECHVCPLYDICQHRLSGLR